MGMLTGILLFVTAGWAIVHIINSIDAKQRRARQQAEINQRLYEMERDDWPLADRQRTLAYLRDKHRWENM